VLLAGIIVISAAGASEDEEDARYKDIDGRSERMRKIRKI
jgi:hypothetical protein